LGLPNGATCYYLLFALDKAGNVSAGVPAQANTKAAFTEHLLLLLDEGD
jgi:hypothetical protein